jgi:hypothetical protein
MRFKYEWTQVNSGEGKKWQETNEMEKTFWNTEIKKQYEYTEGKRAKLYDENGFML